MMDKEILDSFRDSSIVILKELAAIVERLEDAAGDGAFPADDLKEFSQKIDRIMGAAKTMAGMEPDHSGLARIGKLAELCKYIGYKAADQKNSKLLPIFTAFWSDVVSTIQDLIDALEDDKKSAQICSGFLPVLQKRLEWLKTKVAPSAPGEGGQQIDVDSVLKTFGS